MMEALLPSLQPFAELQLLLLLLVGIVVGLVIGLLPGMGTIVAMALMLPFTFGMTAYESMAFLLGMYVVASTSGDITSILIGVPGTAGSAALVLDGYEMTKRGEAGRAMGAAVGSSVMGSLIGAVILAISIPFMRPLVLALGSPERFMLTVVGVSMVGSLSGRAAIKGLIAGGLGFLLAATGPEAQAGISRFSFGAIYLLDGIPLVPLAIGMFAIPEIIGLHRFRESIARISAPEKSTPMDGLRDCARRWWLITRCSLIGVGVGAVPGLGGSVSQWMSYGHALQTSKTPERFGKGEIDGVLGPGAANNSKEGGGLIPTLGFGIPGTASMAVLLGAFLIVGLQPGPEMFSTNLDVTLFMVWVMVVGTIVGAGLLFVLLPLLAKVTFVRGTLVLPFTVLFAYIGSAANSGQVLDIVTALAAGAVALLFRHYGWPVVPVLLGFVLGGESEKQLSIATNIFGLSWLTKPSVIALALVSLLIIWYSAKTLKAARNEGSADEDDPDEAAEPAPADRGRAWVGDMIMGIALGGVGLFAVAYAQQWPDAARMFPTAIGLTIAGLALAQTVVTWVRRPRPADGPPAAGPDSRAVGAEQPVEPTAGASAEGAAAERVAGETEPVRTLERRSLQQRMLDRPLGLLRPGSLGGITAWLLGLLLVTYLIGLSIAFAVFMTAYLAIEDRFRLSAAAAIGVTVGVVHHVVFSILVNVTAPPSVFNLLG